MRVKRRMDLRWRTAGMAGALVAVAAIGWAQQKGNPGTQGIQGATGQLLQQQMVMEQAKTLSSDQASGATGNPRQNGTSSPLSMPTDETQPFFQDSIRAKRNDERQKRLESDTQRLLSLANQLKSEVAVSGAESMTPEMLRQMDEIEKLAKSVKDRMRN